MQENIFQVSKAFHQARTDNEDKLFRGQITFEEFQNIMLGYEAELRGMGVNL